MSILPEVNEKMDLRKVSCPMNAAKALLRLGTMDQGEFLEVLLDDGEPIINFPPAITVEGHEIVKKEKIGSSFWRILIRVG